MMLAHEELTSSMYMSLDIWIFFFYQGRVSVRHKLLQTTYKLFLLYNPTSKGSV